MRLVSLQKYIHMKTETRGEHHVKTEDQVTHLQAEERQRLPTKQQRLEIGKEGFSDRLQREHIPTNTLISDFYSPELR